MPPLPAVPGMVPTGRVLTQIDTPACDAPSGPPKYGANDSAKGKKVVIEYSSPNITQLFYVGYLRNTIISAFLASDWGTQASKYGSQARLEKDVIKHLFDIYAAINKDASTDPAVKASASNLFKHMEDGDQDALRNWGVWREMSVREYEKEYERLNVKLDVYTGKIQVGNEAMDGALEKLEIMSLISESDGVKLVELEKWRPGKPLFVRRMES
ncbi:hypothetical protein CVT25_007979 [Psilocybe cyanescens]|uniref:Arginyl-tRNA synthetase catalytic core domain-containing protein n=1 Tax=Psilocybe cyanescens TaxID=93625 RepID=A0A409XTW8_PSICY|nr:hypothetical protein CVT25_007979 [Psilocybe cyanescens]